MAKIKRSEFDRLESFPKNQKYVKFFEKIRWPDKVISPYDPTAKVYTLANGWYICSKTRKKFNVRTGTVLKHSNTPLRMWYLALCFISANKGASCRKLGRFLGLTPKSAWLLQKDIRSILKQSNFVKEKLESITELDETLVGGSNLNRHWDKKVPNCQGRSCVDKTPLLGMLRKEGYLITKVTSDTKLSTLEPIIFECIKEDSTVDTDEHYRHSNLSKRYNHRMVITVLIQSSIRMEKPLLIP